MTHSLICFKVWHIFNIFHILSVKANLKSSCFFVFRVLHENVNPFISNVREKRTDSANFAILSGIEH